MNAEIINKFIGSTTSILTEYFGISVSSAGAPGIVAHGTLMEHITVMLSVIGDIEGQFMLGFAQETALGVARSMMNNPEYPEFDDLCRSALSELSNIVGGTAATGLAEMGLSCDLAPPSVITGDHMTIQVSATPMLFVPIASSCGEFKLFIALKNSGS